MTGGESHLVPCQSERMHDKRTSSLLSALFAGSECTQSAVAFLAWTFRSKINYLGNVYNTAGDHGQLSQHFILACYEGVLSTDEKTLQAFIFHLRVVYQWNEFVSLCVNGTHLLINNRTPSTTKNCINLPWYNIQKNASNSHGPYIGIKPR